MNQNQHVEMEILLTYYQEDPQVPRGDIEKHLSLCDECQALARDLKALEKVWPQGRALQSYPAEKIPLFERKVLSQIQGVQRATARGIPRLWGWGLATSFAAVILAVGLFFRPSSNTGVSFLAEMSMVENLELLEDMELLENLEVLETL